MFFPGLLQLVGYMIVNCVQGIVSFFVIVLSINTDSLFLGKRLKICCSIIYISNKN